MCSAPAGGLSLEGVDVTKETVIGGSVTAAGQPVPGAYVRLLDEGGEFTAEVVTSATGGFRFFARPGRWTVRALTPHGNAEAAVTAALGAPAEVSVTL
ncbi:MAG TPA: DUF1416 domain-containing protein [Mycobacteriales bacterium]|nr:DUF1416 domain-containing protein [Mycobacteriales bacterium]